MRSYHQAVVRRERWWWCQRESGMLAAFKGGESSVMSPPPSFLPFILQQATGQVRRHWLHLLHLGCLAFFSSPKWSCKFHVAGRVTDWEMGASKWEIRRGPGTSKLHNGLPSQHWPQPASCHLQFGMINPSWIGNHLCPSLFNYSLISLSFLNTGSSVCLWRRAMEAFIPLL